MIAVLGRCAPSFRVRSPATLQWRAQPGRECVRMKQVDVVIGIVVRAGQVLICQRLPDAPLGGYWEFPGGKREPGETDHQCLARELLEETGVTATPTLAF